MASPMATRKSCSVLVRARRIGSQMIEIERIGEERRQGDRDRGGRPEREPERADPEGQIGA